MTPKDLADWLALPKLLDYISQVERIMLDSAAGAGSLRAPAQRVIRSGGKRLRPTLVLACAAIHGKPIDKPVISTVAGVELVHQASLIHDDIIDKSNLRRGQPSVVYKDGLNTAVLLGDYFLAEGFRLAASGGQEATRVLASTVADMSDGQAMELGKSYSFDPSSDVYIEAVRKKSGAIISAACRIGGQCGGLSKKEIEAVAKYGELFGIAFQIIDDIADRDIKKLDRDKALAEARRYGRLAQSALKGFSGSATADGLKALPRHFLDVSLSS